MKEFVVSGLASGELTLAEIAKSCDIERSMIYQWKKDIKRKQFNEAKKPETFTSNFVEVKLAPEPQTNSKSKSPIILRYHDIVLEIPCSHNPTGIAEIVRELGRLS